MLDVTRSIDVELSDLGGVLVLVGKSLALAGGVQVFREKRRPRFSSTVDHLPGWFPWWHEPESEGAC